MCTLPTLCQSVVVRLHFLTRRGQTEGEESELSDAFGAPGHQFLDPRVAIHGTVHGYECFGVRCGSSNGIEGTAVFFYMCFFLRTKPPACSYNRYPIVSKNAFLSFLEVMVQS